MVSGVSSIPAQSPAEADFRKEIVHATIQLLHMVGNHVLVHHWRPKHATLMIVQVLYIKAEMLCHTIVVLNHILDQKEARDAG